MIHYIDIPKIFFDLFSLAKKDLFIRFDFFILLNLLSVIIHSPFLENEILVFKRKLTVLFIKFNHINFQLLNLRLYIP